MKNLGLKFNKKNILTVIFILVVIIFFLFILFFIGENLIVKVTYNNTLNESIKNITNVNITTNNSISRIIPIGKNVLKEYCGDGICQAGETQNCYEDCQWCGDGYCDLGENCSICPADCGNCSLSNYCGNQICTNEKCKNGCTNDCKPNNCIDGICEPRIGENCLNSPDCGCGIGEYCGDDGKCKGGYCGNGVCDSNENCNTCSGDCACDSLKKCFNGTCQTYCGNGVCENNEKDSCPQDCGAGNYKETTVDPNTNYPIILIHGHSLYSEDVSTYSVNGFKEFQEKLDSDGLYKNMGVILPNSNINDYLPGEWGRYGEPISVRTTYYVGILSLGSVITNDDAQRSIDEYGQRLARVVDIVMHNTGKNKVILVAHSMGGLVARSYIKNYNGADKVDKLIMIGTPNHGFYSQDIYGYGITNIIGCSTLHPGQECMDMYPGSDFLNKINAGDNGKETFGNVSYLTIAGDCCETNGQRYDETIRVSSVHLDGADNLIVYGNKSTGEFTFHANLISPSVVPKVYEDVKDFLNRNLSS